MNQLQRLIKRSDVDGLKAALLADRSQINEVSDGPSPLMLAAQASGHETAMLKVLLEFGADAGRVDRDEYGLEVSALSYALSAGNPEAVEILMAAGADVRYRPESNYGAMLNAIHGRDIRRDARLIPLLQLLIERGADLNLITDYAESALRVLSNHGRFDAVELLLKHGADITQLGWDSLFKAVAFGTVDEVQTCLASGMGLETRDFWQRTPFLLSIETGDVAKARLLLDSGADPMARGRCGKHPLTYAVENFSQAMLRWVITLNPDVDQLGDNGKTPLMDAVDADEVQAVQMLLEAGANVNGTWAGGSVMSYAKSREMILSLLKAGADPSELDSGLQRILLGLEKFDGAEWIDATLEEFLRARLPRFGRSNPEWIMEPFWRDMIRTGLSGYEGARFFGKEDDLAHPIWAARRFGQSLTFLPDGRIIQIAGEHEDSYDPDFCIYNDVFVHHPDGGIDVCGYPEDVFPPTDFHTATLVNKRYIWIIGSLGYRDYRQPGVTPVYRLDTQSLRMERMEVAGSGPGWISSHRARLLDQTKIEVSGGQVAILGADGRGDLVANPKTAVLETSTVRWLD